MLHMKKTTTSLPGREVNTFVDLEPAVGRYADPVELYFSDWRRARPIERRRLKACDIYFFNLNAKSLFFRVRAKPYYFYNLSYLHSRLF